MPFPFRDYRSLSCNDEKGRKEPRMRKFIRRPNLEMLAGIVVKKDTTLEYKSDYVEQSVKDLKLRSITRTKGEGYEATYDITVFLQEGDVLLFDGEEHGYIKPIEAFVTIPEAMQDYKNILDLDKEVYDDTEGSKEEHAGSD